MEEWSADSAAVEPSEYERRPRGLLSDNTDHSPLTRGLRRARSILNPQSDVTTALCFVTAEFGRPVVWPAAGGGGGGGGAVAARGAVGAGGRPPIIKTAAAARRSRPSFLTKS